MSIAHTPDAKTPVISLRNSVKFRYDFLSSKLHVQVQVCPTGVPFKPVSDEKSTIIQGVVIMSTPVVKLRKLERTFSLASLSNFFMKPNTRTIALSNTWMGLVLSKGRTFFTVGRHLWCSSSYSSSCINPKRILDQQSMTYFGFWMISLLQIALMSCWKFCAVGVHFTSKESKTLIYVWNWSTIKVIQCTFDRFFFLTAQLFSRHSVTLLFIYLNQHNSMRQRESLIGKYFCFFQPTQITVAPAAIHSFSWKSWLRIGTFIIVPLVHLS